MTPAPPRLVGVVGPSATGKTALAVAVALALGEADLLNADSRQVVRTLVVGTCAPTPEELRGVRCHLLGLRDPGESFSVAGWVACARRVLDELDHQGRRAILVGGTGLYVRALVDGLDLAGVPPDERRRGERMAAWPAAVSELRARDPEAAAAIDLANPRRVVRALEILDARGGRLAAARGGGPGRPATLIGLDASPDLHRRLIAARAERLLGTGALQAEVHSALRRGVSREALDAAGIGYREALAVEDGSMTVGEATGMLARRTRRYARAQRTWFRRDPRIRWLERGPGPPEALVDEVLDAIRQDAGAGE